MLYASADGCHCWWAPKLSWCTMAKEGPSLHVQTHHQSLCPPITHHGHSLLLTEVPDTDSIMICSTLPDSTTEVSQHMLACT